ncbi:hypothetical protein ACFL96_02350 [Thermoproteota archaeon]
MARLTGNEFYFDEASFWASFSAIGAPWTGVIAYTDRTKAWGMRSIFNVVQDIETGHPLEGYFRNILELNVADMASKTYLSASKIKGLPESALEGQCSGRPNNHGNVVDNNGNVQHYDSSFLSPWQLSWLSGVMRWIKDSGYYVGEPNMDTAKIADWMGDFQATAYHAHKDRSMDYYSADGQRWTFQKGFITQASLYAGSATPADTCGYQKVGPYISYGSLGEVYAATNAQESMDDDDGDCLDLTFDVDQGPTAWWQYGSDWNISSNAGPGVDPELRAKALQVDFELDKYLMPGSSAELYYSMKPCHYCGIEPTKSTGTKPGVVTLPSSRTRKRRVGGVKDSSGGRRRRN